MCYSNLRTHSRILINKGALVLRTPHQTFYIVSTNSLATWQIANISRNGKAKANHDSARTSSASGEVTQNWLIEYSMEPLFLRFHESPTLEIWISCDTASLHPYRHRFISPPVSFLRVLYCHNQEWDPWSESKSASKKGPSGQDSMILGRVERFYVLNIGYWRG